MRTLDAPPGFRGAFRTDSTARALACEGAGPFRIMPQAVAHPLDVKDLVVLLTWAADTGAAVTPRGAGSGMPGGNIGPGVVVDLGALDRPVRVGVDATATVGAAVTWRLLNDTAAHLDLRLPPDPSSGAFCTLGGMVATNAAGARSFAHGSIRRWVRGVELVTADGECAWFRRGGDEPCRALQRFAQVEPGLRAAQDLVRRRFPRTSKNSAGYALDAWLASHDVLDLLIGSEGTLGIVTRVELTLDHTPVTAATVRVGLRDLDDLGPAVAALAAHRPVAIELLDRSLLDLADAADGCAALLLAEFEGSASGVTTAAHAAADSLRQAGAAVTVALDPAARAQLWAVRHAASPALARLPASRRSLQIVEDGCVPVARLAEYLRGVHRAAARRDIPVVAFGHAGDGHLHVNALVDTARPDTRARLLALQYEVTDVVLELGGTPSGEHGDGRLRAGVLERLYGAPILQLFAHIKRAFDPAGIMNPGVILSDQAWPALKVERDAPAVPPEIEARLRERERAAAWGASA